MSFTIAAIVAAAAPAALEAIGNFVKENRGAFNALLKQSKPAVHDMSKKLDNELNKYTNDGWSKDKEG